MNALLEIVKFNRKISLFAIIFVAFSSNPSLVLSSDNKVLVKNNAIEMRKTIKNNWINQRYDQVIDDSNRNFDRLGRRADVAYWWATSLCRKQKIGQGRKLLFKIKNIARNDPTIVNILDKEINICDKVHTFSQLPRPGFIGSSGNLKRMELEGDSAKTTPVGTKLITLDNSITEESLNKRLTSIDNPSLAIKNTQKIFESDKEIQKSDLRVLRIGRHFNIVCWGCNHKEKDLRLIGQGLEDYLRFFEQEYGMRKPDDFITIYAATSDTKFNALAKKVHGVEVGITMGIIGYSIPEDMSIVAMLPNWNSKLYGTLKHELFHLMMRSEFGDAPPWLEEGMAALYEESYQKENKVVGKQNWREDILRGRFTCRPTLKKLLEMNWMEFSGMSSSADYIDPYDISPITDCHSDVGVIHATARYFILYLQNKGKLSEVYNKMKVIEIVDESEIKQPDARSVLEQSLSMSIDEINQDFTSWFKNLKKT
jgi:hypothetical protein